MWNTRWLIFFVTIIKALSGVLANKPDDVIIKSVENTKSSADLVTIANEDDTLKTNGSCSIKSYCSKLNEKYKENRKNLTAYVLIKPYSLVVMSTNRAPSQATATLIAMALRYRLGYNNVFTRIDNRTNCELASSVKTRVQADNELLIHVDADWKGPDENCSTLPPCTMNTHSCSIAGSRLSVMGAGAAVHIYIHAVLGHEYLGKKHCKDFNKIIDKSDCGFLIKSKEELCVLTLVPPDVQVPTELLIDFINNIRLCPPILTDRKELAQSINNDTTSFFFIDYDLYKNNKRVMKITIPTQNTPEIFALRDADQHAFRQFAPLINDMLQMMAPQPEDLRQIINLNASIHDIDEAACKWIDANSNKFEYWTNTNDVNSWILILTCKNDPDFSSSLFYETVSTISAYLNETIKDLSFTMKKFPINCSDSNEISTRLTELPQKGEWQWLAGVAAMGAGAEAGVKAAKANIDTQLVLYDVPPTRASLHNAAVTSTGNLRLLAQATRFFIHKQRWQRVAIVSDKSPLAEDFTAELILDSNITYGQFIIEGADVTSVEKLLEKLKEAYARIIILNCELKTAQIIMYKAADMNMVVESEYAWIVRELQAAGSFKNNMRVFSVSYWWYGGNYSRNKNFRGCEEIYSRLDSIFGEQTWPRFIVPLTDALLLIAHRLAVTVRNHPELRYDYHRYKTTSLMAALMKKESISGVIQPLDLYDHSRKDPLVFVTSWRGNVNELLALWQAKSISNEIVEVDTFKEAYPGKPPYDGSTNCKVKTGNLFSPRCDDGLWAFIGIISFLIPLALWSARQAQKKHLKKKERETLMRLLTRSERTANILGPYLVERSALELRNELGVGHFGRVRFGLLRQPNREPIPVGAKALCKDPAPAEEAEFLREASTLAQLSHPHVIRLIGVCADDGPPLLLMEHAFFGDLLQYLRARKHLAELNDHLDDISFHDEDQTISRHADQESYYVSPLELTRLVREAAEGLAYLNECQLLHRDTRAANCLVDDKRSLKLGDFGMARKVGAKTSQEDFEVPIDKELDNKYFCRRRGIFPVPWMAPESLEHGEFSHASDVWALGILTLEVATLGARPYGPWRPFQVLRYVQGGGRPPLPIDASYHTCEVVEKCCSQVPQERATAKQISEYLRWHPRAVRAALRPAWPAFEAADSSDSGLGDNAEHYWANDHNLRVSTL